MLQKLMLGLLMAGLTAVAASETVYKWVDARGQVHFTDLPPSQSDAKVIGVFHEETGVVDDGGNGGDGAGNSQNGETPSTPPADDASEGPPASNDTVAAVQADVANARNKQCKEAQDRYKLYVESRRLFRQTPDGKREYLTDKELAEARVKAKQSVDDLCS
jgi:hypothetical protein